MSYTKKFVSAVILTLLVGCTGTGPLEVFVEGSPSEQDLDRIEVGLWLLGADYEFVDTPGRGVVTWEHMPECIEAGSLGVTLPEDVTEDFRACGFVLGGLGHGTGCERKAYGIAHPTVVAHELGHVFGAEHHDDPNDIMHWDGHLTTRPAKVHMEDRDVVLQRIDWFTEDCGGR